MIPFAGDQFFWAERLRVAGVARAAVDGRWPRAEAVVSALDFAADDRVRKHSRVLGEIMRSENGVVDAVAALERIVRDSTRSMPDGQPIGIANPNPLRLT